MNFSFLMVLEVLLVLGRLNSLLGENQVPVLAASTQDRPVRDADDNSTDKPATNTSRYLPLLALIDPSKDTSEFWRETDILSLVLAHSADLDPEQCRAASQSATLVRFPSRRTVRTICRGPIDRQLCPQCPHFTNHSECELFRDSCKERKVLPSERTVYCDRKYGRWRSMLVPADYSMCRCCDECVFYRELDQSCMADDYNFDVEEFLPITSIDFRAGCNPYWGHPEQEFRALRCDKVLRRCVPMSTPAVPKESMQMRRSFRYEPPPAPTDCPVTCRGYHCPSDKVEESACRAGAFLPHKESCNCCGKCSPYQQLNEKCAEFKKTEHNNNGSKEIEVEEEFLEPGCDDGLVCRQGRCQDIHAVRSPAATRRKRDEGPSNAREPCKRELKLFKKKYGPDGHLHYDAPQCTPLWLYAPVQCRRFVCYCALEDGAAVGGVRVPRVEVSSMNCDCARERCRTGSDVECDGYGNYREAVFAPHRDDWPAASLSPTVARAQPDERSTPLMTSSPSPPGSTTPRPTLTMTT